MKIFKSTKPEVCGTAKRPIRRWLLPLKSSRHTVFIPLLIFMFTSSAVIFDADNKGTFIDESRGLAFSTTDVVNDFKHNKSPRNSI